MQIMSGFKNRVLKEEAFHTFAVVWVRYYFKQFLRQMQSSQALPHVGEVCLRRLFASSLFILFYFIL